MLPQAVADANRQKAVLEIKIEERVIEAEGDKRASQIQNTILQVASLHTLLFLLELKFLLRLQRTTRLILRNTSWSRRPQPMTGSTQRSS